MQTVLDTLKIYWPSPATSGTDDQEKQKLEFLHNFLSHPHQIEVHHFRKIRNFLTVSKFQENHPVVIKVQEILSKYPHLEHLSTVTQLKNMESSVGLTTNYHDLLKQVPPISGNVLNVKCTLEAIKLIIKLEGKRFKEVILREFDDEVVDLITKNCSNLESLQLRCVFYAGTGQGLSDEGLGLIAKLQKLKKLNISSELSLISNEAFEKLLSTPTLQAGLNELTIHNFIDDKSLGVIAKYQSLKSLDIESSYFTTQGLLALFQSPSLRATLEKINVEIFDHQFSKGSFNDAILTAFSNYKQLRDISLGSNWQVTPPVLTKFLDVHKNIPSLALKGLALDAAGAAKIGEMEALTSLQISDCSKLSEDDFCALLNNKTHLTHLNLGQAWRLAGRALEKLSHLPALTVLYFAGSSMEWSNDFESFCNVPEMQKHLKELYLTDMRWLPTEAFTHIGKLAALTVLRFDNCPQFNDDALRGIFENPLKNQLDTLQFKNVAITQESFKCLNDATSLKKLLIASCFAITEKGRVQFFDLTNLQKNLKVLLLDHFRFQDPMVKKLINSFSLETLAVINNDSLDSSGMEDIWDIHKNSGGQAWGIIWGGPTNDNTLYDIFSNSAC